MHPTDRMPTKILMGLDDVECIADRLSFFLCRDRALYEPCACPFHCVHHTLYFLLKLDDDLFYQSFFHLAKFVSHNLFNYKGVGQRLTWLQLAWHGKAKWWLYIIIQQSVCQSKGLVKIIYDINMKWNILSMLAGRKLWRKFRNGGRKIQHFIASDRSVGGKGSCSTPSAQAWKTRLDSKRAAG